TTTELKLLHTERRGLVYGAQRQVQRHVPRIWQPGPRVTGYDTQLTLAARHHLPVIVLAQIAVRTSVVAEHRRLENELLQNTATRCDRHLQAPPKAGRPAPHFVRCSYIRDAQSTSTRSCTKPREDDLVHGRRFTASDN